MDAPYAKEQRVMDTPIYLQFLVGGDVYHWYVIEEKVGADKATAASDELPEELWIRKTDEDRVRVFSLPKIEYNFEMASFAVAKSRLFLIGGRTSRGHNNIEDNGILHIDLQSPKSWERFEDSKFNYVSGAAVSDDGYWIYAVTDQVLRFNCHTVGNPEVFSLDPVQYRRLLASTGSKMLLYSPPHFDVLLEEPRSGHLGFFDLESHSWEMMHIFPTCKENSFAYQRRRRLPSAVVVGDSFMIDFASHNPNTLEYHPALYVYDIRKGEWLQEPVQGLENNGIILPFVDKSPSLSSSPPALFQLRRDELKLALVWSDDNYDLAVVYWSKFILHTDNQSFPPTFHARVLSSGICSGGDTALINVVAG